MIESKLVRYCNMKNPGKIRNKVKRTEVYAKYKQQKKRIKKKLREEHVKEIEALGEEAPPKQVILSVSLILRDENNSNNVPHEYFYTDT